MLLDLLVRLTISGLIVTMMAFSMVVFYRYRQLWKIGVRSYFLPLHVWTISGSYYLLLLALATRDPDWRAVIYLPALLLGIFSMWTIWKQ